MVSVFELFHIGIGPSSSHTVGPMRAAMWFAQELMESDFRDPISRICVTLHGSLGATGKGHGTGKGVILGLSGQSPESVLPSQIISIVADAQENGRLSIMGAITIPFDIKTDIVYKVKSLPQHPNGLTFQAFAASGDMLLERRFFSIGGGAVIRGEQPLVPEVPLSVPFPFNTAAELLTLCKNNRITIAQLMMENEKARYPEAEIHARLDRLWEVMQDCVRRGFEATDMLPGPFKVRRRAKGMRETLLKNMNGETDLLSAMDWLNVYALAVSEENAAGGQVVTAPTNGAAGIIPSVLHYYMHFIKGASIQGVREFLLTAAAIGTLYKTNASISGAEVGCQGEVGVACSMAAGGLCAIIGGTPDQIENAAEIGMEHHLGLTCDPVGGLVQIPCIERNAMASSKAVNAARLALHTVGEHHISLDAVIKTMWETGADMKTKYKETARGGLAVNIKLC
ncbi:L-serine ammonia-lyase [Candidimonas sp. SYP-B2681]|uniref:L-serine ammonia-lyase n=1 Tax=Candidimonas sp. SYP-B2681 TaxID=2497686 RepID=UPI000F85C171|nr:L-serine ammonia-lyase [Candidimonas sp. SYP-B2681]RTZ47837.1 L-serine ammonia-lyase [Candidimonas sp. SYP-B2681]